MKTIILGRDPKKCNQPFPIKDECDGVSREHAKITITDHGDWYLEDLDSSNGTYVRDESTGEMIPVSGKKLISPMTFIFLGPDNSKGCCFFAKQADKYGNFTEERQYLVDKEEEFDRRSEELESNIKKMRIIGPLSIIIMVFVITGIPVITDLLGNHATEIRLVLSSMSGIVIALYDGSTRKKKLQDERERWHHCPNPCCSNKQTTKEIKNMRCSKCKK